jgi:hypothetical protein
MNVSTIGSTMAISRAAAPDWLRREAAAPRRRGVAIYGSRATETALSVSGFGSPGKLSAGECSFWALTRA